MPTTFLVVEGMSCLILPACSLSLSLSLSLSSTPAVALTLGRGLNACAVNSPMCLHRCCLICGLANIAHCRLMNSSPSSNVSHRRLPATNNTTLKNCCRSCSTACTRISTVSPPSLPPRRWPPTAARMASWPPRHGRTIAPATTRSSSTTFRACCAARCAAPSASASRSRSIPSCTSRSRCR